MPLPRLPDVSNLFAWLVALWLAAAAVLLVLAFTHSAVRLHWTTVVYLTSTVSFSLLAFLAMGFDKYRASRNKWRVPEINLHMFELLGGWPGSLLGQRTFHHKTRKIAYQAVFLTIIVLHLLLMVWMLYLWWNAAESGSSPDIKIVPAIEPASE